MKNLVLILLFMATPCFAQSGGCSTATCTAAGLSPAQFLAALPSPSNSNATVVVNLPSGTGSWTSTVAYTIPSAVTSLTIQGNTTVNCTGTAGTSSYGCTATDNTIIQDSVASNAVVLNFTTSGASQFLRITGITFEGGSIGSSSNNKFNGVINIGGPSTQVRWDDCHINNNTYSPAAGSSWARIFNPSGVFDHNVVDLGAQSQTNNTNGIQFYNPVGDTIGYGDGGFQTASTWGTSASWYMENNQFNGGYANDCADAGRFVMRYNTFSGNTVTVQTHGTKSAAGSQRGCREYEYYHNYVTATGGASTLDAATGSKNATFLIWGNILGGGYYHWSSFCTDRNACESPETAPPNGWGSCGTGNGSGSAWDGNQPTLAVGYPCLDGIGRGQTTQALNGANFPGRLNSVTGTVAWPQQYLEPAYFFDNSIGGATEVEVASSGVTVQNTDYFLEAGSFNGTVGTGFGLLSARPSMCTPGLGGTYYTSPTGSYGVAYFATNVQLNPAMGMGELYVCTSTNTWTPIYQPYVYPHPLVSGGATVATPTFSQPSGGYSSSITVTITSATAGATICYTTNGSTPTATVPGTCSNGSTLTNGGSITVSISGTIQAIGTLVGSTNSAVATSIYSIGTAPGRTMFAGSPQISGNLGVAQ